MSNGEGKGKEGEFDGKTFLFIRTNPADDGSEPLPAGLPFWVSPDIAIIQPSGARGYEAVGGQVNQVEVVVTNGGGITAVDAYVEAFLADPSTVITPMTAAKVGDGYVTVGGYTTKAIAFPWQPLPTDSGHRCLLARVALFSPLDCYRDGSVFDVVGDRHVAQRNINVVAMEAKGFSFGFRIVNPLQKKSEFLVRAAEVRTRRAMEMTRRALGCGLAQFAEEPVGALSLVLSDIPVPKEAGPDEKPAPVGILDRNISIPKLSVKSMRVTLQGSESRYAVLSVRRNSAVRSGDLHVLQVEQVDVANKRIVGGLWVMARA